MTLDIDAPVPADASQTGVRFGDETGGGDLHMVILCAEHPFVGDELADQLGLEPSLHLDELHATTVDELPEGVVPDLGEGPNALPELSRASDPNAVDVAGLRGPRPCRTVASTDRDLGHQHTTRLPPVGH